MSIELHQQWDLAVNRHGVVGRRSFLRGITAAAMATGSLNWVERMAVEAARLRQQNRACILLWMQGGPSQFETFSPKPNHANGGETRAISTSVPGIQIAENLPETAQVMDDVCIIRSVNSKEGSHPRASFLLHTGYLPSASVKHPTLGSLVSHQLSDPAGELPSFVRIGARGRGGGNGGFLGVAYDPFVMRSADRPPRNVQIPTGRGRYQRRLELLNRLEQTYAEAEGRQDVTDHKDLYQRTAKMSTSPNMEVFDLDRENAKTREAYGNSGFGSGCLLARRLIESGVTFVEVAINGWDTHQDNFANHREMCGSVDGPYAQLLRDLKQRDLLDTTLVIWMGEFGRTPRINGRGGRDHYPKAFNVALAGGGVYGGQVIGSTNVAGTNVSERPVSVPDLFRTFCSSLNIDPDHENMSAIGRPIRIADEGEVVHEVFG